MNTTGQPGLDMLPTLDQFDPATADMAEKFKADQVALSDTQIALYIERRQLAYKAVFGNMDDPNVRFVLEDLAFFTRAHQSAFNADPRIHALIEGRREVYYRIADNVQLPRDLMYDKYVAAANKAQRT